MNAIDKLSGQIFETRERVLFDVLTGKSDQKYGAARRVANLIEIAKVEPAYSAIVQEIASMVRTCHISSVMGSSLCAEIMDLPALSNCPFCDGPARPYQSFSYGDPSCTHIACSKCGASGPSVPDIYEGCGISLAGLPSAAMKWNGRRPK